MNPGITGDEARFGRALSLLRSGVGEKAYQAAVLLAARGDEILLHACAGDASLASIFDVASVTKPLVAALFYVLVQQGALSADAKLSEILPVRSADPAFRGITFRHLLCHTTGLPAYRRLYAALRAEEERAGKALWGTAEGHDRIVNAVLSLPLESAPGEVCTYSDLGYILLGRAIETASFTSLDRLLKRELTDPLEMRDTGYLPLSTLSDCETGRLIPTGHSEARGREKVGEVDDENAAAMGGVAGHAGVFSCAYDLFRFAREVLRARKGRGRVLTRSSATEMTTKGMAFAACARTPGWDTPRSAAQGGSQAGHRFPEGSIGHLGYTGCSLWIDPSREITVVLLTNRVYWGPDNPRLGILRPAIHDAVMERVDGE